MSFSRHDVSQSIALVVYESLNRDPLLVYRSIECGDISRFRRDKERRRIIIHHNDYARNQSLHILQFVVLNNVG